jgi:hypothetical protein
MTAARAAISETWAIPPKIISEDFDYGHSH